MIKPNPEKDRPNIHDESCTRTNDTHTDGEQDLVGCFPLLILLLGVALGIIITCAVLFVRFIL